MGLASLEHLCIALRGQLEATLSSVAEEASEAAVYPTGLLPSLLNNQLSEAAAFYSFDLSVGL